MKKIDAANEIISQSKHHFPPTGFVRLASILAPEGPIPVGLSTWWAGVRSGRFSQAREAWAPHHGVESRGHPHSYRESGVGHGEAVQLPPRQNPSELHDRRACRPDWCAQADGRPVDFGRTSNDRFDAALPHQGRRVSCLHAGARTRQTTLPARRSVLPWLPSAQTACWQYGRLYPAQRHLGLIERYLSHLRKDDLPRGEPCQDPAHRSRSRHRISEGCATPRRYCCRPLKC